MSEGLKTNLSKTGSLANHQQQLCSLTINNANTKTYFIPNFCLEYAVWLNPVILCLYAAICFMGCDCLN